MIDAKHKLDKITSITDRYSREIGRVQDTIICLELLETEGVQLVKTWYDIRDYQQVSKSDLPTIRRVVGKLKMVSKDTSWDFERDGKISVVMAPVTKRWGHMRFTYDTPYRKGGRCEVVTTSTISTSLVCKV